MGIGEFKDKVKQLYPNLNKVELRRLNNLTSRHWKFLLIKYCEINYKQVTEDNLGSIWFKLNKKLASEDRFHRREVHLMRNSKHSYEDYSYLAYNGVTEDF